MKLKHSLPWRAETQRSWLLQCLEQPHSHWFLEGRQIIICFAMYRNFSEDHKLIRAVVWKCKEIGLCSKTQEQQYFRTQQRVCQKWPPWRELQRMVQKQGTFVLPVCHLLHSCFLLELRRTTPSTPLCTDSSKTYVILVLFLCGTMWQMPFKGIFWEIWSEDGESVNRFIWRYILT